MTHRTVQETLDYLVPLVQKLDPRLDKIEKTSQILLGEIKNMQDDTKSLGREIGSIFSALGGIKKDVERLAAVQARTSTE